MPPVPDQLAASPPRAARSTLGGGRLRPAQRAQFLLELSDLLDAGCQVERALLVLSRQVQEPAVRRVVQTLHARVVDGASLGEAMAACGPAFSGVHVAMVRAAETGGFLQRSLRHLAEDGWRRVEAVGQVRRSLVYPAVLLATALASIVFLMTFVVPRFATIYQAAETELPLPTRILLDLSTAFTEGWWFWLPAAAALFVGLPLLLRRPEVRTSWHRLLLRLPAIGLMVRDWQISRFASTMALLLDGGLPAVRALALTEQVLSNLVLRQQVARLREAVERGEAIGAQLSSSWPFPPALAELLHVGETSGKLSGVLSRVGGQYERRFSQRLSGVMALVEPAVILIVGALIGFVVAAMLLPVLLMNTLVG